MKDLDWKEHLRGPHAAAVKAAFHKEMAEVSCILQSGLSGST